MKPIAKKTRLPAIAREERHRLVQLARDAAGLACCPYSRFPVGAALLASDGRTFTGCNVENVSFGLSMCAERVALYKAVSEGCRSFRALAVAGGERRAVTPCGACRQALAGFCPPLMPIFLARLGPGGRIKAVDLASLLPSAFETLS